MPEQVLDHVGFAGPDLEAMRLEWQRLGFLPTLPQALHAVADAGEVADLGQWSCHVMLESGYIELTEVRRPTPGHHLAPWLARGPGLCIIAYGTADIRAWHAACGDPAISAVMTATRHIDYGERGTLRGEALFRWCMRDPASTPAALECVVEHMTPDLVFQSGVQQHPNSVHALRRVQVSADRVIALELLVRDPAALRGCLARSGFRWADVAPDADGPDESGVEVELATAPGCALRFFAAPAGRDVVV